MAEITASLVKELREKTGAGMMDCKKALTENDGNLEVAIDWLRKKGLAAAAKKSSRVAAEGLVAVAVEGKKAAVIELNSETDFVARNEKFQALARNIAKLALNNENIEDLQKASYPDTNRNVLDEVTEHVAIIGENMNLRRSKTLSVSQGIITSYVHNAVAENLGKIGVLIAFETSNDVGDKLNILGKQIAMHIAAAKPEALNTSEVNQQSLDREKQIFSDQARASGKPDSIIEKMVEGRIKKYYEEIVLLEQIFVLDNKTKISDVLFNASKEFNTEIKIKEFVRFALGEGIEQEERNFADEVKAITG